jgi:hypothetical protein
MTDFDKIMKFELVNNLMSFDYDGEFKDFYSKIEGFPAPGESSQVPVDLVKCTREGWQNSMYDFSESGFEDILELLITAGTLYCVKQPEKLQLFGSEFSKIRSYLTLNLLECSGP